MAVHPVGTQTTLLGTLVALVAPQADFFSFYRNCRNVYCIPPVILHAHHHHASGIIRGLPCRANYADRVRHRHRSLRTGQACNQWPRYWREDRFRPRVLAHPCVAYSPSPWRMYCLLRTPQGTLVKRVHQLSHEDYWPGPILGQDHWKVTGLIPSLLGVPYTFRLLCPLPFCNTPNHRPPFSITARSTF